MTEFAIRPLSMETWPAFEDLGNRHNGVWGGCWDTWFHVAKHGTPGPDASAARTRDFKKQLVEAGHAHSALVFDGETAIGWASFGSPEELPGIHHSKQYLAETERLPDYRVTCFFTDKNYRRQGVAKTALRGALELIAQDGGGVVEGYPFDIEAGKKMTSSFLYSATRKMFEEAGFSYVRPKGLKNCVMTITVPPPA